MYQVGTLKGSISWLLCTYTYRNLLKTPSVKIFAPVGTQAMNRDEVRVDTLVVKVGPKAKIRTKCLLVPIHGRPDLAVCRMFDAGVSIESFCLL